MEARVYECESKEYAKLKQLLEKDSLNEISFARQGYKLKEGKLAGGEAGKYYVHIKANEDFFKFAEEKFKEVQSVKRTEKTIEAKIIKTIEDEENSAEAGFGSLFG